MDKLTVEQLDTLVQKRNAAGFQHTVEVMNREELAAYRVNCVEAVERLEGQIKRAKDGGVMQGILIENQETLRGYIAYIDAKLAEQEAPTGMAVIDEFLNRWEVRAYKYYTKLHVEYLDEKQKVHEITAENLKLVRKFYWSPERKYSDAQVEAIMEKLETLAGYQLDTLKSQIHRAKFDGWKEAKLNKVEEAIMENMYREGFLEKTLKQEKELRRAKLIAKVEAKAGKILDAKGLKFGDDGSINGTITGEKKTVTVTTIYAGGHSIQCLHYRVLVK